jgi:hypothetical protein
MQDNMHHIHNCWYQYGNLYIFAFSRQLIAVKRKPENIFKKLKKERNKTDRFPNQTETQMHQRKLLKVGWAKDCTATAYLKQFKYKNHF